MKDKTIPRFSKSKAWPGLEKVEEMKSESDLRSEFSNLIALWLSNTKGAHKIKDFV